MCSLSRLVINVRTSQRSCLTKASSWHACVKRAGHFSVRPERIVALSLVMVLCLLVYRLAEHWLRELVTAHGQTVPSQLKQPTDRPTMR